MRARLSDDRRRQLLGSLREYFEENFDEPLSEFRADGLLDFFLERLGPPLYNQGVSDAVAFVQDKLVDVEGEVYVPDRV